MVSYAAGRQESAKLSAAEIRCKREFAELLAENRARIIGPVRPEILSAVRHRAQFERLRTLLRQFDCEPLATADFESAIPFDACEASVFLMDKDFAPLRNRLVTMIPAK